MAFRRLHFMTVAATTVVFGFVVNSLVLSGLAATKSRNIQSLDIGNLEPIKVYLIPEQQQEQLSIHHSSIHNTSDSHSHHELQYHHDKLMFVHIGKTAGETLKHHLRVTCTTPRRNDVKRDNCYKEWQISPNNATNNHTGVRHESEISQRTVAYMHCNMLQPSSRGGMLHAAIHNQITTHLFCIRSPVNRILSWFHYIHPAGCRGSTRHDTANCVYKRRLVHQNNTLVATFASCFPTLLHFLDSLRPSLAVGSLRNNNNSKHNTNDRRPTALDVCAQTAHAILHASSTNVRVMGHSYFNYDVCWLMYTVYLLFRLLQYAFSLSLSLSLSL
jgi:Sulfotransferase family